MELKCDVREAKWSDKNNEKEGEGGFIEKDVSEKGKQRIDAKYKTSCWYKKNQFNKD